MRRGVMEVFREEERDVKTGREKSRGEREESGASVRQVRREGGDEKNMGEGGWRKWAGEVKAGAMRAREMIRRD